MEQVDVTILRPGTKVMYQDKIDGPEYMCCVRDWPWRLHDGRHVVPLVEMKGVVLTSHITKVIA